MTDIVLTKKKPSDGEKLIEVMKTFFESNPTCVSTSLTVKEIAEQIKRFVDWSLEFEIIIPKKHENLIGALKLSESISDKEEFAYIFTLIQESLVEIK